ncbi:hypothetical protein C8F01DRAFT_226258 [Mycena amicta]|nr:hypothetical protein C8F01DRAFT_226258 [Mycena amicta]
MVQTLAAELDSAGEGVVYFTMGVLVQTVFFGMYTILVWFSTRMLLERKLNAPVNRVMFGITTFMYLLSAAYWVFSVANVVSRMQSFTSMAKNPAQIQPSHTRVTMWSPLFNSLMLINYVISDGVVVWRAWIICLRHHRKFLWITVVFLVATTLAVLLTIVFRIAGTIISPIESLPTRTGLGRGIDVLQVLTTFTSLMSNLTATGVVSATAWGHWKSIRSALSNSKASSTRTNHILLLVVESGVLYCISALITLVASVVRLPQGTLGDIYIPVSVQIAGAYPSIVLLLVSTERSLSDSTFGGDSNSTGVLSTVVASHPIHFVAPVASRMTLTTPLTISFATNPTSSSVSRTSSRTEPMVWPHEEKTESAPPHAAFDSMV